MKRLLRNSIYAIIIVAILVIAARVYEEPVGSEIKGETPFERVSWLINNLNTNENYKNFGRAVFVGYDTNNQLWKFSLFVFKPAAEIAQEDEQILFEFLGDIVVKVADQIFINEGISVLIMTADAQGYIALADSKNISKIRDYPSEWSRSIKRIPIALSINDGKASGENPEK